MKTAVDIRALTIRDLNAIESIERRSYPTPWSRSMFAGELAKPASLCLGAFEDDRLAGYLITSRYVDAWHVMNIAVNPSFRRRGIATALLERLFELTDDGGRLAATRWRFASRTRLRSSCRAPWFYRAWQAPRLLHRQPRGRARHVARSERRSRQWLRALILAIETSCDETACALVSDDGRVAANVVASQAELHARYGGVVPEIASRHHLELVAPVVRESLDDAAVSLDDVGRVAVTQGPGLIGALLVGLQAAKAIAWSRGLPLVPVDHLHGHVASLFLEPDPLEPPFFCLLASGGHTMLLDVHEHARWDVLGSTLDDAAGEAFDKGARLLGLPYPGGAEIDRLARTGDPKAFSFPSRASTGSTSPSPA